MKWGQYTQESIAHVLLLAGGGCPGGAASSACCSKRCGGVCAGLWGWGWPGLWRLRKVVAKNDQISSSPTTTRLAPDRQPTGDRPNPRLGVNQKLSCGLLCQRHPQHEEYVGVAERRFSGSVVKA